MVRSSGSGWSLFLPLLVPALLVLLVGLVIFWVLLSTLLAFSFRPPLLVRSLVSSPIVGHCLSCETMGRQRSGPGVNSQDPPRTLGVKGGTATPRRGDREARRWTVLLASVCLVLAVSAVPLLIARYASLPPPLNSTEVAQTFLTEWRYPWLGRELKGKPHPNLPLPQPSRHAQVLDVHVQPHRAASSRMFKDKRIFFDAFIPKQRRIGEASNPGPYSYGGASSSYAVPRSMSVGLEEPSGSNSLPASQVADASGPKRDDSTTRLPAQTGGTSLGGIDPTVVQVHAASSGGSSTPRFANFDDPDAWDFGAVEEIDPHPNVMVVEDYDPPPVASAGDREVIERSLELETMSAMVAWESCPAIVEGVVDLPTISEDQLEESAREGFRTNHGWWVSAPHVSGPISLIKQREAQLGISGMAGRGSGRAAASASPLSLPKAAWKEYMVRELLSCGGAEVLPAPLPSFAPSSPPVSPPAAMPETTAYVPSVEGALQQPSNTNRERKPRRRRGRGRRGLGEEHSVSVWSFNSSGGPQLRAAVKHCTSLGKSCPIAILSQEHHARDERLVDLQAQLKRSGWRLAAAHAVNTSAGGRSAGVGVCTPGHVAAGVDADRPVDTSPLGSPGRVASLWVQQVVPCGVQLLSCYLHDAEQGTTRNVDLLARALSTARSYGCPWIIGLDAQEEPGDLLKWAAPLIDRAQGTIIHSDEPTHVLGVGASRRLDYFIVDKALATAVMRVTTISELRCRSETDDFTVAPKPHKVVQLELRRKFLPLTLRCLRMPRAFPRVKPIGCARAPVPPACAAPDAAVDTDRVSSAYARVVAAVERELSGVCDIFDSRHWGRAEGFSTAFRPLLPRRAAGRRGAMAQNDYAQVWLSNRVAELLVLSHAHSGNGGHSSGQVRQWRSLLRKVCSPTSPVAGQADWDSFVQELQVHFLNPKGAIQLLTHARAMLDSLLQAKDEERKSKREASWEAWKARHRKAGGHGGALYSYIKRVEDTPDLVTRCLGSRDASPQAIVDADFTTWSALWSKLASFAEAPWRACSESRDVDILPPLRHKDLRAAASSFKVHTASGVDALLPSHFTWLSDELLDSVGLLFESIESCGKWPAQVATSVVHLIPKTAGGRRPIGLLASFVRLWERARRPIMKEWSASCRRQYNWMAKGLGAERSVWAQALYEEAAVASGKATASILLDLVKAFEQVVLGYVWEHGLAHLMPKRILTLALELCTFARRLSFRGAVSEEVHTMTAILAGGGFATDLLFVTLIDAIDEVLRRHEVADTRTVLRCFVIVDDIRLQVEGPSALVDAVLPAVARHTVELLEDHLQMQVSRNDGVTMGKTVVLFSSSSATGGRRKICKMGFNVVKKVKNLGVHFTAGARRSGKNEVAASRFLAGLRKVRRAKKIGRAAHRLAIRSVLTPSFTYGSAAASCPRSLVRQLRTHTAVAYGPCRGRSTSARLLVEDVDIGQELILKCISAWVTGVWDNLIEQEVMITALKAAQVAGMMGNVGARGVLSGAAAYLDSLQRIGWSAPSFDCVRSRTGHLLYFGEGPIPNGAHSTDLRLIKLLAKDDYEATTMSTSSVARDFADLLGARGYPSCDKLAWAAANLLGQKHGEEASTTGDVDDELKAADLWRRGKFEHSENGPIPWIWPVRRAVSSLKKNKCLGVAASIRSLVEGGWPTQFRLYSLGLADHPKCVCGEAVGSLRHKLSACRLSGELRSQQCPGALQDLCRKEKWHPLFSRGVPARPRPPPLPTELTWVEFGSSCVDVVATGDVYTDGSARGNFWCSTRGGWSLVVLDDRGRHLLTKRGTLGGVNVSSHRAELRAVLEVLRVARPPLRVHIDNKSVLDGLEADSGWGTDARDADADLWRQVWSLLTPLKQKGVDAITFHKVKAHTGWTELLGRSIHPKHQFGNWLADLAAKESAKQSEILAPTASFEKEVMKARDWIRWIAHYVSAWISDVEPTERPTPAGHTILENPTPIPFEYGERYMRHELWATGGEVVCSRCGISYSTKDDGEALSSTRCNGSAAGRAAAFATGNINFIWTVRARTKQSLLRRGAQLVSAAPPPRWAVDPSALGDAAGGKANLSDLMREILGRGRVEGGAPLFPWLQAPSWMPSHLHQPWETDGDTVSLREAGCARADVGPRTFSHRVAFVGPLAYCTRCACFAERRLGAKFKGPCVVPAGRGAAAASSRLRRLRQGLHPIAGARIARDDG